MTIAIFGREEHQAPAAARSTCLASKSAMLFRDREQVVDIPICDRRMERTLRFPIRLEQWSEFIKRS